MIVDGYRVFLFKIEVLMILFRDLSIQRHDDADFMPLLYEFRSQGADHIGQTAALDERKSLSGCH